MTRKIWKAAFSFSAALVATLLATGANAQQRSFNLPEQDATRSIPEFARQAGIQISAPAEALKGTRTPPIKGELDVREALERLLEGTGLTVASDQNGMIVLRKAEVLGNVSNGAPVPTRLAQANESEPSKDSPSDVDEPQDTELSEIVVTARKRLERLQDVPLSISVVSADDIERRGLVSSEDYLRGMPGVNQLDNFVGQTIVIRGIETSTGAQNFASGTTVGTYFGETPTTTSAGVGGGTSVDIKLVDIERVEVLRGPQGTAFGSSSLGGTVRTIPVAPSLDRFEGKLGASYSNTAENGGDNTMIQAVGNLPLIADKLAVRAVAYRYEESGIYRNLAGSDPTFQAIAAAAGAQASAVDKDEAGAAHFTGGRIAALFQPTDDLKFTLSYLTQETEVDGQARTNTNTSSYNQTFFQVAQEQRVRGEAAGVSDTDIDIANATMEYNFGWAAVMGTYSHVESGAVYAVPIGNAPWSDRGVGDHEEDSGEIRLTTKLDGAWNVLAGVYAEKLDDDFLEDGYQFGNPLNLFGITTRFLGTSRHVRHLEQKAAYAEASWKFLDAFTLTGGARAYDFERDAEVIRTGALFGASVPVRKAEASGTNFRANLSYQPNEDALIYADWSQGFRLGRPQPGVPAGICDTDNDGVVDDTVTSANPVTIASTQSVSADELDNVELGSKFSLLNRRLTLSAAVYVIDWANVPFNTTVRCGNPLTPRIYTANAGEARSKGAELEVNFQVTPALRLDLGSSYVNAELTQDAPGVGGFEGDRLPGSPKVNASLGVQYGFNIAAHPVLARADSTYVGSFYNSVQQLAPTKAGGYTRTDASLRVTLKDLSIDLFVRNLTNADDFVFRDTGGVLSYRLRPRTVGVQLGYNFK